MHRALHSGCLHLQPIILSPKMKYPSPNACQDSSSGYLHTIFIAQAL